MSHYGTWVTVWWREPVGFGPLPAASAVVTIPAVSRAAVAAMAAAARAVASSDGRQRSDGAAGQHRRQHEFRRRETRFETEYLKKVENYVENFGTVHLTSSRT